MDEDDLYTLPLSEFVAARDRLAKETGEKALRKLTKPTAGAWVVNQAVRSGDAGALWAAGDTLARTQLQGGSADEVRAAEDAQEAALDAVLRDVDAPSVATRDAAREALRAAAADPTLRDEVGSGRLTKEPVAGDPFAAWASLAASGSGGPGRRADRDDGPAPKRVGGRRRRADGAAPSTTNRIGGRGRPADAAPAEQGELDLPPAATPGDGGAPTPKRIGGGRPKRRTPDPPPEVEEPPEEPELQDSEPEAEPEPTAAAEPGSPRRTAARARVLERRRSRLQDEIARAEERVADVRSEVDATRGRLRAAQVAAHDAEADLEDAEAELEQLRDELGRLEK